MKLDPLIGYWRRQFADDDRRYGWPAVGALLFLMVCPVVLLATINYAKGYRELTDSALSRKQAIVSAAAATLEEKLQRMSDLSVSLATRVRFRQLVAAGHWEEAIEIVKAVPADFPFVARLFLVDLGGSLRAHTPPMRGERETSFSNSAWYRGVVANEKPFMSGAYQRPANSREVLTALAAPVKNDQGTLLGLLVLEIKSDTFLRWIKTIPTGRGENLFVVDRHGKAVADPNPETGGTITDLSGMAQVQKALRGQGGVEVAIADQRGGRDVIAYQPIASYGWAIIARQPQALAFELRDKSLRRILLAYSLAVLITCGAAYGLVCLLRARRRGDKKFHDLVESAPDGLIMGDHEGKIVMVNAQAEKIFGYARHEMIGNSVEFLMPARSRIHHPKHRQDFLLSAKPRSMGAGLALYGLRKDGSEFPIDVSLSPVEAEGGLLVISSIRDITERRRLQDQLQAKNEELAAKNLMIERANRLKSEFLANMSHELRTPLNGIIGFAELMHDGKVGPVADNHKEYLADILTSGKHLLGLINDVLDLAKVEAGKMEFRPVPIRLTKVVGEVADILRAAAANKRIHVHMDVDPAVDNVVIDPAKLKQVLYNYLSNALKFTADNGAIWLRAKAEGPSNFRLEVEDNGVGIGADQLDKLFIEFQQLDSSAGKTHQGTGLGLALTKKIVQAQDGQVGVESAPGRGSKFFAILPRLATTTETKEEMPPPLPCGKPPVLVIEDNGEDQKWVAGILRQHGYDVEVAATGGGAIERARQKIFSAILLDLILPDMVGWPILRAIRSEGRNRETPIIVTTIVAEKSAALGFPIQDYLSKPVEAASLISALERAGVQPPKSRGKILIVDDDPNSLKIARLALEPLGYQAICKSSGASGLALAEREPPDAVILDLLMPEMDGFAFLERLRRSATGKSLPVIVWTNQDLSAAELARLCASAQSVAMKTPGGFEAVVKELEYLVDKKPNAIAAGDVATARQREKLEAVGCSKEERVIDGEKFDFDR